MSRIVLATSGSYGDVHPYIAVGLGLKSRGHSVCLAAPEYYRAKVQGEGLDFHAIRPDFVPMEADPATISRAFDPMTGAAFLLRRLVLPYVEQTYADLLAACEGADLMLIHPTLFPAPLVAEKLGIRWVSVVLSPLVFVSAYDPPVLPPLPWMQAFRRFGPWPHRLLLRLLRAATRGWMRPVDEIRRREGLSADHGHPMHDDMFSPYGTLAWFSPTMGTVQPDWPLLTEITGFPVYDRDSWRASARLPSPGATQSREAGESDGAILKPAFEPALEPGLSDFLDAGAPPVVFTLGSSAVVDARDFYDQSREAVSKIGCRAVFVVGHGSALLPHGSQHGDVFVTAYAPFSEIFPRAAAIVHQGGIGTTGQALAAGVPMLVVPLGLDQPDNAARVTRLGGARVLPRRRYQAKTVEADLNVLLTQPQYAAAAARVGALVRAEDGIGAACSAIEKILCGDSKTTSPAVSLTPRATFREAAAAVAPGGTASARPAARIRSK